MSERPLAVGLVQQACTEDRQENLDRAIRGIADAAAGGAGLVLLQELVAAPYFCKTEDTALFNLAEPVPGPTTEALGAAAKEHGVVVATSVFERRAAGLYHNTGVVMETDGSLAGIYRKMHIPDDPGYSEKFYFTPGDTGFRPVDTSVGRIGLLICWDQWYPEAARLMALAGAEILLYPTAIGWDDGEASDEHLRQREAWMTVQRGHAIANCLPVAATNRVGHEADPSERSAGNRFWGSSFVCGPQGEILGQAGEEAPEVLVCSVDLARTETLRRIWPFLRDRRVDAYADLSRRFRD